MKGILKFDLINPKDRIAFNRANKALELSLVILNHLTYFKRKLKDTDSPEIETKLLTKLQNNLIEQLNYYNIDIDEMF